MKNQTKIILGVIGLGVVYFIYTKIVDKPSIVFKNASSEDDLELAKELQNKTKVQQRLVKKSPTVDSALFNREKEQIFSEESKIAQLKAINELIR